MSWTNQQKIFSLETYFATKSYQSVQIQFRKRFHCHSFPPKSTIVPPKSTKSTIVPPKSTIPPKSSMLAARGEIGREGCEISSLVEHMGLSQRLFL